MDFNTPTNIDVHKDTYLFTSEYGKIRAVCIDNVVFLARVNVCSLARYSNWGSSDTGGTSHQIMSVKRGKQGYYHDESVRTITSGVALSWLCEEKQKKRMGDDAAGIIAWVKSIENYFLVERDAPQVTNFAKYGLEICAQHIGEYCRVHQCSDCALATDDGARCRFMQISDAFDTYQAQQKSDKDAAVCNAMAELIEFCNGKCNVCHMLQSNAQGKEFCKLVEIQNKHRLAVRDEQ